MSPALAQPAEGYALVYVSIPLDASSDGPATGLRLGLVNNDRAAPGDLVTRAHAPPPVLEVRFGVGEEPGEWRLGGIAPAMLPDRLGLDGTTALWIGTGLGIAAAVAIVVAADKICIGINTSCSKDTSDDDDNDASTNEPTRK